MCHVTKVYEVSEVKTVDLNGFTHKVALFTREPGEGTFEEAFVRILLPAESDREYDQWVYWSDPDGKTTNLLQKAGVQEV